MLRATVAMLVLLCAGCPAYSGGGADAGGPDGDNGDGDGGGDGGSSTGLSFEFTTAPALADLSGPVSVDDIRMGLRDVRAIGDAAPGDSRTSIAQWPLEWRPSDDPTPLDFPLAPQGIYSSLEARLGAETRLEIRGHVRLTSGTTVSFRVEDDNPAGEIAVSLAGLTVGSAPRVATIVLSLSFLEAIDWDALAHGTDEIQISDDSPQLVTIRAAIAGGFSLAGVR